MLDNEHCVRCMRLAKSFRKKSLEDLSVLEADPKSDVKDQWAEAEESLAKLESGSSLKFDQQLGVFAREMTGYRMSAKYGFMTVTEFTKLYDLEPKALSLKPVTLKNEEGTKFLLGILFKPAAGDELMYRIVTYFHDTSWSLHETVMKPEDRLRIKEPEQTFAQLTEDHAANHPAVPCETFPTARSNFRCAQHALSVKALVICSLCFVAFISNSKVVVWPRVSCMLLARVGSRTSSAF